MFSANCGLFWQTWMKLSGTVSQNVTGLHGDREGVKCYDRQRQQKLNTKDQNRIHRRLLPNTHRSRAESRLLIKGPRGNGNKWHPKKPLSLSNRTTDLGSELHPQGVIHRFISQKLTPTSQESMLSLISFSHLQRHRGVLDEDVCSPTHFTRLQ